MKIRNTFLSPKFLSNTFHIDISSDISNIYIYVYFLIILLVLKNVDNININVFLISILKISNNNEEYNQVKLQLICLVNLWKLFGH